MNNDPTNKSGEGNGDPLGFSKLGEMDEKKEYVITKETKINEIEGNLEKYLENDLDLESNLLTYALKEKLEENPEELKKIFVSPNVKGKLKEKGAEHIAQMIERIRNLEVIEKEHYTFLIPIDKWEEGKIELPKNKEADYIAPSDLTAILKQPVTHNFNKETDGRSSNTKDYVVYGEDWVGKEIHHFPNSKELLGANEEIEERFGYHLPEDWGPIRDGIRDQLNEEGRDGNDFSERERVYEERLRLAKSGYVREGDLKFVGEGCCFLIAGRNPNTGNGYDWKFGSSSFVSASTYACDGESVRLVRSKNDEE